MSPTGWFDGGGDLWIVVNESGVPRRHRDLTSHFVSASLEASAPSSGKIGFNLTAYVVRTAREAAT